MNERKIYKYSMLCLKNQFRQSVRIASLGRMELDLLQPCIPYRDASLTGCKAEILSVFLPSDTSLRDVCGFRYNIEYSRSA